MTENENNNNNNNASASKSPYILSASQLLCAIATRRAAPTDSPKAQTCSLHPANSFLLPLIHLCLSPQISFEFLFLALELPCPSAPLTLRESLGHKVSPLWRLPLCFFFFFLSLSELVSIAGPKPITAYTSVVCIVDDLPSSSSSAGFSVTPHVKPPVQLVLIIVPFRTIQQRRFVRLRHPIGVFVGPSLDCRSSGSPSVTLGSGQRNVPDTRFWVSMGPF